MKDLDIAATARIREGIWGNAPDATVQGMLVKDGFDQQAEGRFGVTVHWQPIGYVDAAEWQNLDAEALLSAWRRQVEASNAERRARGDAPVEILGMAAPPRSDAAKGTATWAKRYRVGPDGLHRRRVARVRAQRRLRVQGDGHEGPGPPSSPRPPSPSSRAFRSRRASATPTLHRATRGAGWRSRPRSRRASGSSSRPSSASCSSCWRSARCSDSSG